MGPADRNGHLPPYQRLKRLLWLTVAGLQASCITLGPDYVEPKVPLTPQWSSKPSSDHAAAKHQDDWWQVFSDPVLNALVLQAWAENPDRQAALHRIMEARARLGIARGNIFPQHQKFGMDLSYDKLSEAWPYYDSNNSFAFASFQTGFDAIWEMDLWGRYRRGIESAQAQLEASSLDHDDIVVSLTAEVATTYVEIRTIQQRLIIARANAAIQKKTVDISRSRFVNGLNTELDMQQAIALLNSTEAEIAELEKASRQAAHALCVLLGKQPSDLNNLIESGQGIPKAPPNITTGIPADILRRRPDIRREERKAAAQSALIGVAESDLYPRFSLYGAIGIGTGTADGTNFFDMFSMQTLAAKVGPTVSWPILNYGRLKNNVKSQDEKFSALLAQYRSAVLNALREVEDALIGFQQAQRQTEALTAGVAASQRAVDLALRQYQEGLEDYTRVLNSQQFLVKQQDQLIRSQGDVARYLIASYKALGGGWEVQHSLEQKENAKNTAMLQKD